MEDAIRAFWDWLWANGEERYEQLRQWAPRAFSALTDLLWRILQWSVFCLGVSLVTSGVAGAQGWFDGRVFLPWVGILYACVLGLMLYTRQALNSAGLLVGIDAAVDIFKGITPISTEKLGKIATLGLDFPRLKELATLQLVGRLVFNVLLFELLVIFTFSFVPIWTRPGLAGHLVLGGLLFGLLSTPWGQASPFGQLAKPIGCIPVIIILVFAWGELGRVANVIQSFIPDNWPFWFIALVLFFGGRLIPKEWFKGIPRRTTIFAGVLLFIYWLGVIYPSQPVKARVEVQAAATATQAPPAPAAKLKFEIYNSPSSSQIITLHEAGVERAHATLWPGEGWRQPTTSQEGWEVKDQGRVIDSFQGLPPSPKKTYTTR